MIAIASDHGGVKLKMEIINHLRKSGIEIKDLGTHDNSSVDYPDYAKKVALSVIKKEAKKGIVICGTGIGISIASNKVHGIRCALCTNEFMARMSREHNDSNMLALGERVLGVDLAKSIVDVWVNTEFSGGRHQKRIDKITNLEKNN